MSTLLELAWKVAAPLGSGAVGVATTLWKVTKDLEDRVRTLEKERLPRTEDWLEEFKEKKYPADLAALQKLVEALATDVAGDFERLHEETRGRGKERREERRLINQLAENYFALQTRVTNCETAINKLNDSFTKFAEGQQDQWQEISRSLGHIEGWLRAMQQRHSSGGFQSPPRKT